MATLEKFRLLATQCGVVSVSSPVTSPLVRVPRQKTTLRALFSWNSSPRRRDRFSQSQPKKFGPAESSGGSGRATLKDLFGSSSSSSFEESDSQAGRKSDSWRGSCRGLGDALLGPGSPRPIFLGLRYRALLRKAWRPMLETIPE